MQDKESKIIKISVRNLVEFILSSGDIQSSGRMGRGVEAMQEGSRIHRKIQKKMGADYCAEVPLSILVPVITEKNQFDICVEGRADGIIKAGQEVTIDEIKAVYMDLGYLEEPIGVHLAQVKCYAHIYAQEHDLEEIGIQVTYCNMETEDTRRFYEKQTRKELSAWFERLIKEYAKWADWQISWKEKRNHSIQGLEFPFEYRQGQKDLVSGVYRTILRERKLFIEAPTGVGKTISTVFPAVKAMGEGIVDKIFYLTAKTITRTVAEDTFRLLSKKGMHLKVTVITAKDKICIFDKAECDPFVCERAKGHYDRINDAVFDMLSGEEDITRELIGVYAEKHKVCPFEMCLDVCNFSDVVICDYNYVFDPNVSLKRFFMNEKKNDFVFLIDEAHNLVERAREMYSAVLYKQDFLDVKKLVSTKSRKLEKRLEACNRLLLQRKRECEECEVIDNITDFVLLLMRLMTDYDEFLQEHTDFEEKGELLKLYFGIRHFLNIYDLYDDKYITYTEHDESGGFMIKLQCMDPSHNLLLCLEKGRSAVFFSATLLPVRYYLEQLGGCEEDYAVYAPSPFDTGRCLLMVGKDVSTRYSRRNSSEYWKIYEYIVDFTGIRTGNYMVFFPSYQMMEQVALIAEEDGRIITAVQKSHMSEQEREAFLEEFVEQPESTRVGFCVMGGIFSEGIDLKDSRLIGAVIVGTGLPMVCNQRELFRNYYEEKQGMGFEYAYLYQGMNKVLQSAGRVIRTQEDKGAILLLDDRFLNQQYQSLFPREWFPYVVVNKRTMKQQLINFWEEMENV